MQFLNRGKTQENVIYIRADCFCRILPRKDIGNTVICITYYYISQIVTLVPPYVAVHCESGCFT